MNKLLTRTLPPLLITACALISNPVFAAAQPEEFQADARMHLPQHGPVDDAWGLLFLESDGHGNGRITVMFSNASELELARFNARVQFLDARGGLLGEEHFACWMDSAGLREAVECRLSRPLTHEGFDSIEVDFYLSDVPAAARAALGAGAEGAFGYLARH